MSVATLAAGAVASRASNMPKSATLGAVVFLAGAALVYWSLFRSRDGKGLFGLGAHATAGGSWLEDAANKAGVPNPLGDKEPPSRAPGRDAGGASGGAVRR